MFAYDAIVENEKNESEDHEKKCKSNLEDLKTYWSKNQKAKPVRDDMDM